MITSSEKMVFDIVEALCAHYTTREKAICENTVSPRVRMEYIYVNSKMLDASSEVVGEPYARSFILDIGSGVGYANTKIDAFSETAYKKSKLAIKRKIGERLHFLDVVPDMFYKSKK